MPVDTDTAMKIWTRYAWARDNGHTQFIEKADKCDAFFRGDQWDRADKARLAAVRPARWLRRSWRLGLRQLWRAIL